MIGNPIQELRTIALAKRFDRERFEDDTAFADWVQSRARAAIAAAEEDYPPSYGDRDYLGPVGWRP